MLQLIKRCPEYAEGYKAYCQGYHDHNVVFFSPSNPKHLVDDWFERTKDWYDRKEKGLVEGRPVSFHYWAADEGRFIGGVPAEDRVFPESDAGYRKRWLRGQGIGMEQRIRKLGGINQMARHSLKAYCINREESYHGNRTGDYDSCQILSGQTGQRN